MNDRLSKEKIKIHFMYVVIILVLSNVIIGAFLLFGKENALSHLSSAGTLLSIVLAIVAILITLWDIAGQKNSIYEIKEQVEKVKSVTDEITATSETFIQNAEVTDSILKSLREFESKSGANFEKLHEQITQVITKVEESNGSNDNDETKQKLISELNEMKSEIEKSKNRFKNPPFSSKKKSTSVLDYNNYLNQLDIDLKFGNNEETFLSFIKLLDTFNQFKKSNFDNVYEEYSKLFKGEQFDLERNVAKKIFLDYIIENKKL